MLSREIVLLFPDFIMVSSIAPFNNLITSVKSTIIILSETIVYGCCPNLDLELCLITVVAATKVMCTLTKMQMFLSPHFCKFLSIPSLFYAQFRAMMLECVTDYKVKYIL